MCSVAVASDQYAMEIVACFCGMYRRGFALPGQVGDAERWSAGVLGVSAPVFLAFGGCLREIGDGLA